MFAGAGIVEGSVPSLEWDETAIKFEPMLDALRGAGADLEKVTVTGSETMGRGE